MVTKKGYCAHMWFHSVYHSWSVYPLVAVFTVSVIAARAFRSVKESQKPEVLSFCTSEHVRSLLGWSLATLAKRVVTVYYVSTGLFQVQEEEKAEGWEFPGVSEICLRKGCFMPAILLLSLAISTLCTPKYTVWYCGYVCLCTCVCLYSIRSWNSLCPVWVEV